MARLKLDFAHPAPRPHWVGWLLLAAGLVAAGWSGWQGRQAAITLEHAVADAPRPAAAPVRRAAAQPAAGEAAVQGAQAMLAAPWDDLLRRLEGNRPKHIALVALEADTRKPEASVTAEARNAKDMLNWVEQLKAAAGFETAILASHTVQETDPQQPLRFVVRLTWRK